MDIEKRTESQTVVPAGREIPDFHPFITSRLPLTPEQKPFFSSHALGIDIADGEPQDESPYQTQDNLPIPIHDIFRTDIGHLYPPPLDEIETFINIFELLNPQLWFRGISTEGLAAEDFEEMNEDNLDKPTTRISNWGAFGVMRVNLRHRSDRWQGRR